MWRNFIRRVFKKPEAKTAEQIKLDRQKWLDEGIKKSSAFKQLISDNQTGWKEFIVLLDDYIERALERKLITDMSVASPAEIREIQLLDRDVQIIQWVKQIPEQFIGKIDKALEDEKKEEEKES